MSDIGQSERNPLQRAASWVFFAALAILFSSPFGALPWIDFGAWRLTSVSVLAMHAGAFVAAICLLFLSFRDSPNERMVLAWAGVACMLLVLASLPGTLLSSFPALSLFGAPQSGLGLLWFAALGLMFALFANAWRHPAWAPATRWAIVMSLAGLVTCRAIEVIDPKTTLLIPGADSYAYLAVAAVVPAVGERRAHPGWAWPTIALSIALLLFSTNKAAVVLTVFLGVAVLVIWRMPRAAGGVRFLAGALPSCLSLTVLLVAPVAAVWFMPDAYVLESLKSRVQIFQLIFSATSEFTLLEIIFGHGWGHTQALFYSYLLSAGHPIYDTSWDFIWRDVFHTHNGLLEVFISAGLLGAIAYCYVFWRVLRFALRRGNLGLLFLVVFYLLHGAIWFEFSFALPFLAAAAAWTIACQVCETDSEGPEIPISVFRVGTVLLAGTFTLTFTALVFFERGVQRFAYRTVDPNPLALPSLVAFPDDPRGNHAIEGYILRDLWRERSTWDIRVLERDGLPFADRLVDHVSARLHNTKTASLLLVGIAVFDARAAESTPDAVAWIAKRLDLWEAFVARHLELEPARFDISFGYANHLVNTRQMERLSTWTDARLRTAPDDPVANYFAALAYLGRNPGVDNTPALKRIHESIELGLELVIPVDFAFKKELEARFGTNSNKGDQGE